MSSLKEIAEHLSTLDDDSDEVVSGWTEQDKEVAEAEFNAFGSSPDYMLRLAAYIGYDGRCGFANSGTVAFVINRRNDAAVRATVRVKWRAGINSGQYDRVKTIPAGSRVSVGCTVGHGIGGGDFSFSVVGAVVL